MDFTTAIAIIYIIWCIVSVIYSAIHYKPSVADVLRPFGRYTFRAKADEIIFWTHSNKMQVFLSYWNLFGKHSLVLTAQASSHHELVTMGFDLYRSGWITYTCESTGECVYGCDLARAIGNWDKQYDAMIQEELDAFESYKDSIQEQLRQVLANPTASALVEFNSSLQPSLLSCLGDTEEPDIICVGTGCGLTGLFAIDFEPGVRNQEFAESSGHTVYIKSLWWVRDRLMLTFIEVDGSEVQCCVDQIRNVPTHIKNSLFLNPYFDAYAYETIVCTGAELQADVQQRWMTVEQLSTRVVPDRMTDDVWFEYFQTCDTVDTRYIVRTPKFPMIA